MENGTQAGVGALGFSGADSNQDTPTNPINDLATQDESRLAALAGASDMPPGTPSGGASIAQMLTASPHLLKIGNQTQKAMKANPALAAQPMGWARALVGAGMDALGGGGLSDAAAASEKPTPPGAGWLSGVTQTMKARSDRKMAERKEQSEEQTQQLLRAETMQRIAMNTRNIYKQEKQDRNSEYNQNDQYMKTLRTKYNTTEDQDNVTQDQLNDFVKKNPNFWKTHTGRAVGEEPVMENGKQKLDKDGNPVFSPLYSISNTAGSGERTAPLSAAESKYIKDNTGENLPENTLLTVEKHDNVMARADAARSARQKVEKANDEDLSAQQARELNATMNDPSIQRYMAMVPGEPIKGLFSAKTNVEAHISSIDAMIASVQAKQPGTPGQPNPVIQALQQKRQQFADEDKKVSKALTGFNEKAMNDYEERIAKEREDEETHRHNLADEATKRLEVGMNAPTNIPMTPELKQKIDSLPAPQKALISRYDTNTQSSLMAIAFGNGEQDLEKNFPSRLTKGAPGLNTQQALGVIHQLNPNWSEQSYAIKQAAYKSATTGDLSKQRDSLNNFIGHASEARIINNKLFNTGDPKLFKSTLNKLSTLGYGTEATELAEAISVVNGEFDTMVKAGFAPTAEEAKAQAVLVNENSTVGQINGALNVMGRMGATRANTMDSHYRTMTGDHFPNLIDEENQEGARQLGIPVEKYYVGGRIGGSGSAPQMQNTQTGQPGKAAAQQPPANAKNAIKDANGKIIGYN